MKRRFLNNNFSLFKFFDKNGLGSIPRTFISSFVLVLFFYLIPFFLDYLNEGSREFQNNSKAVLAYTLENDGNVSKKGNIIINEKDLLRDIFSLNELETDTVRLNASTIKQLFEDTKYKLDDVRKN